jgi:hypothetical protein
MALKLSSSERASIDLVLDRVATADQFSRTVSSTDGSPMTGSTGAATTSAVQQLLSLLGTLPAMEPSADLVPRTMALIDRTANMQHSSAAESNSVIESLSRHPSN